MLFTRVRIALVARGIVAPKCEAFGGISPADFGMDAYKLTVSAAKANVAYYSKALRKVDGDDMAALADAFRKLDAATMEVEMLENAYNQYMTYAEAY